jgi:hypothetical protein
MEMKIRIENILKRKIFTLKRAVKRAMGIPNKIEETIERRIDCTKVTC